MKTKIPKNRFNSQNDRAKIRNRILADERRGKKPEQDPLKSDREFLNFAFENSDSESIGEQFSDGEFFFGRAFDSVAE